MFMSRFSVKRDGRPLPRRRPLVEALEGRQLLSTFTATEFGSPPAQPAIVGNHIGAPMIQGNHIGTNMVVGSHIGSNVVVDALPDGGVGRKH